MQPAWIFCICLGVCVGSLAVEADPSNTLEKITENGTNTEMTYNAEVETAAEYSREKVGVNKPKKSAAEDTQQPDLGRTLAAWVELNSVLKMRDGVSGKLNTVLDELRNEKRRLLGQGNEPAVKKKKEDDTDEEEEEEEDDDDEEEEEEEEEGEEGGEGGEEEEGEEEENEGEENEAAGNSTAELLPEGCQLNGTEISCADAGIAEFPIINDLNITGLHLAGNNFTTLKPEILSGLSNLEVIDLSRNFLDDLSLSPDLFMNLTNLKRLTLDGNGLEAIPLVPGSLEELRINDNQINQVLAHNFEGLSNLLHLELAGNILWEGSIEPQALQHLTALKHMRLDNNRFTSIPFGLPASIVDLSMSHNQLVEVQENVLNSSVHLAALDLSHNLLSDSSFYPGAWINLPNLNALDLSYNQLYMVPTHLPRVLRQLSLQNNFIQSIPPDTLSHMRPGLQSLRLSHNQLPEHGLLGKAFRGAYKSLEELLLDNNRLERVPPNIRYFKNLQQLRLDHNLISAVPVKSVCKISLTNSSPLLVLHLENNYIDVNRIPRKALSCIPDRQAVILEPQAHNEIV